MPSRPVPLSRAVLLCVALLAVLAPAAAAERPFQQRFHTQTTGGTATIGNTLMTCTSRIGGCDQALTASPTGTGATDNQYLTMKPVDVDADASTSSSSTAALGLPAGAEVLYARLYWSARAPARLDDRRFIRFKAPGSAGYSPLTADVVDGGLTGRNASAYQASADVTDVVARAGAGTYAVADVRTSFDNRLDGGDYAGWALAVAYRDPAQTVMRDISVFDGFTGVGKGPDAPPESTTIRLDGFKTPTNGTVRTDVGVVAWEGDRGLAGDGLEFDGTPVSSAVDPATNVFNSTVGLGGALVTTRNPAPSNTFGVDVDAFELDGALGNGARSADLEFTSSGDVYTTGVATFVTDLHAPRLDQRLQVVDRRGDREHLRPGDWLWLLADLKNTGDDTATNARTTMPVPPGLIEARAMSGGTLVDGVYVRDHDDLAPGSSGGTALVDARVPDDARDGQAYEATATTTYDGGDYARGLSSTRTIRFTVSAPDLAVDLARTPDGPVEAGTDARYTLTVRNDGSAPSRGTITLDSQIQPGMTAAAASGEGWTCDAAHRTCTTDQVVEPGGRSTPVTLDVAVDDTAGWRWMNRVTVSGGEDSIPENNTTSDLVTGLRRAEMSVALRTDRTTTNVGDVVTATMRVANAGPGRSAERHAAFEVPSGWQVVRVPDGCSTISPRNGYCVIPELPRGGSTEVAIDVVPRGWAAKTTGVIKADIGTGWLAENDVTDNAAETAVAVTAADLQATTSVEPSPPVPGRRVTAKLVIHNAGPSPAEEVGITVSGGDGLLGRELTPSAGSCDIPASGSAYCRVGTIKAGDTAFVSITGTVPAAAKSVWVAGGAFSMGLDADDADNGTFASVATYDGVKPTITGSADPAPNAAGWYRDDVRVTWECADGESGIAGCEPPLTLRDETPEGRLLTGTALDRFGNTAQATVGPIRIDKTAPLLTGTADREPNAFGWYRDDVVVGWSAQDGLSGVAEDAVPGADRVGGEGRGLHAPARSVLDRAGNAGASDGPAIDIDRTAPDVRVTAGGQRGDDGWYTGPVTVRTTCADELSGVAECAADTVLATDGGGQSASGTGADKAGNRASAEVRGIDVDSHAPRSQAAIDCPGAGGWCRDAATVTLTATDAPGAGVDRTSGVRAIRYRVGDGGDWTTVDGDRAVVTVPLSGAGTAVVHYRAVDAAGNAEAVNDGEIRHDSIAPSVTHVLDPAANAAGWNRTATTVRWRATDGASGLLSVSPDVLVDQDTAGRVLQGSATDRAGNTGTDTATVRLDRTAPTIKATTSGTPGLFGWYRSPVRVRFACEDPGAVASGVASCTEDQYLQDRQAATGTATDVAGNTATVAAGPFRVDAVAPAITLKGIADGGVYTLGRVPAPSCSATDAGSGTLGCVLAIYGGRANGVGTFGYTAVSVDWAGNLSTVSGTFSVRYAVKTGTAFWQSPINDTANVPGQSTSVFKAGSTVSAKFRLTDADGRVVRTAEDPVWIAPAKGGSTKLPVTESAFTAPATTGDAFDEVGQGYQFNWKSPSSGAGAYWRLGVRLDDGTTQTVNVALR